MISVEKFYINSESLIRKFEDSEGFLLIGHDITATNDSLYLFVNTYKYIKEYLKILNDNIKDSLRALDESHLLNILKEKQKEIIFYYDVIDINRLIAIKYCINVIRSSRIN